jgi:hypothetical protein
MEKIILPKCVARKSARRGFSAAFTRLQAS